MVVRQLVVILASLGARQVVQVIAEQLVVANAVMAVHLVVEHLAQ